MDRIRQLKWGFVLASFLILFTVAPAESASVKLAWNPVPDSSVVGYRVHYGDGPGKYTHTCDIKGRLTTEATIDGLDEKKTWFFTVTSYDAEGKESGYSKEIANKKIAGPAGAKKKKSRAEPGVATPSGAPQNKDNAQDSGRQPVQKRIPHTRQVAKDSEGKILQSR
jgi:hypothetical protein